ncbi:hypothetical protein, partial [Limnohabitans sp. G3-2]|uniref:hypothetical protein n=1 Tax=Limnohabitans sp. G3-2 TaxID=1100711 RepID=UPI001E46395D
MRDAGGVDQVCNDVDAPTVARAAWRGIGADAAAWRQFNLVAGAQADGAAVVHQACGRDGTAIFDHAAQQSTGGLGRQDDQAAGGLHRLAVVHQRLEGGRGHQHVGQL